MQPELFVRQIERHLRRDARAPAILDMARLGEALLTHLCESEGCEVPPRAGLGQLIQAAMKADLIGRDERDALNELNQLRIPIAHYRVDQPVVSPDTLYRLRDFLETWLVKSGQCSAANLRSARNSAVTLQPERLSVFSSFPPIDRTVQRGELEASLERVRRRATPVLVLGVPGPAHQGQQGFADHTADRMRTLDLGAKKEYSIDWPLSTLPQAIRTRELFESVAHRLDLTNPPLDIPWTGATPPSAWNGWLKTARANLLRLGSHQAHGLYLVHTIRDPHTSDWALMKAYHDHLVAPAFDGESAASVVIQFNLIHDDDDAIPFVSPSWWRYVFSRRKSLSIAKLDHLSKRSTGAYSRTTYAAPITAFGRIQRQDIEHFLIDELDYDEHLARETAKALVRRTRGRFSDIAAQVPGQVSRGFKEP